MKKLITKCLAITGLIVLSTASAFSQAGFVNSNDMDSLGYTYSNIVWSQIGVVIQTGGTTVFGLCPGDYEVTYNFGQQTETLPFTIGPNTAGINELQSIDFSLQNPFFDQMKIDFEKLISGTVVLINANGQIVLEQKLENVYQIKLETTSLKQGKYFLQLSLDNQHIVRQVVKN